MFDIVIETKAKKMLLGFEPKLRAQIAEDIYALAIRFMDGKRLTGKLKGYRSWRSGDFRIIYDVLFETDTIRVLRIGHRKDVYRDL